MQSFRNAVPIVTVIAIPQETKSLVSLATSKVKNSFEFRPLPDESNRHIILVSKVLCSVALTQVIIAAVIAVDFPYAGFFGQ
jgi:hypothetical protein